MSENGVQTLAKCLPRLFVSKVNLLPLSSLDVQETVMALSASAELNIRLLSVYSENQCFILLKVDLNLSW